MMGAAIQPQENESQVKLSEWTCGETDRQTGLGLCQWRQIICETTLAGSSFSCPRFFGHTS